MLVIETRCEIPKQSHCQDEKYARNMLVWAQGIRANLVKIHL